ncbi:hypothetical protein SBD_2971 [Streptomyces bottropensis ATCC 25435]|uniref:Uncharacterized protein n=1 Tax=Streptomyces bottropensis ATCC 25435 TaxID=1054862 RepID=M3F2B3_9ACTN|nr:hypothetical protein SBD_2971 [Streptomyces bottropensis ATCC 25435]
MIRFGVGEGVRTACGRLTDSHHLRVITLLNSWRWQTRLELSTTLFE